MGLSVLLCLFHIIHPKVINEHDISVLRRSMCFINRIVLISLLVSIPVTMAADDQYAFVTIYYPNGKLSKSDFVGIRTMYKSFTTIKSKAEFIVLTVDTTSKSDIQTLENDGMKVKIVKLVNPYRQKDMSPDLRKTMNLLTLWDMTEYKRVIFVDYYTVFMHNLDSLFECSYLCLKDEQPLVCSHSCSHV